MKRTQLVALAAVVAVFAAWFLMRPGWVAPGAQRAHRDPGRDGELNLVDAAHVEHVAELRPHARIGFVSVGRSWSLSWAILATTAGSDSTQGIRCVRPMIFHIQRLGCACR